MATVLTKNKASRESAVVGVVGVTDNSYRNKMSSVAVRGSVIAMLVLGFVSHIAVAFAGPFEDALAAYERHEYGTALNLCVR